MLNLRSSVSVSILRFKGNDMKNALISISLFTLLFSSSSFAETVLVANKNFKGKVTEEQLKLLLKARGNTLSDGQKVDLFIPSQEEEREKIAQNLLNISNNKLQRRYNKIVFSGEGSTPQALDTQEILAAVRNKSNAIGFVEADQVDDSVKILRTSLW